MLFWRAALLERVVVSRYLIALLHRVAASSYRSAWLQHFRANVVVW